MCVCVCVKDISSEGGAQTPSRFQCAIVPSLRALFLHLVFTKGKMLQRRSNAKKEVKGRHMSASVTIGMFWKRVAFFFSLSRLIGMYFDTRTHLDVLLFSPVCYVQFGLGGGGGKGGVLGGFLKILLSLFLLSTKFIHLSVYLYIFPSHHFFP